MVDPLFFKANGKLLITGEYLVLKGAEALALPVRFGQSMHLFSRESSDLFWSSKDAGNTWFSGSFSLESLAPLPDQKGAIPGFLSKLLVAARSLNPSFIDPGRGLSCVVKANYPVYWGLGSSSTLIALVADWAKIDKFELFKLVSNGSGYDISCSDRDQLMVYQRVDGKRKIEDITEGVALRHHACFAYLGRKQDTNSEVNHFLSSQNFSQDQITRISELTRLICKANDVSALCKYIDEHEGIVGSILNKEPVSKRFPGFPGSVKSLGAWGGDFAMFVSKMNTRDMKHWLKKAGLDPVFSFDQLKINP